MSSGQREPTREQLLAMAYADGELDREAEREFERLLPQRRDLALEVAAQQRLAVMARQVLGPEPADYEWQRLAADPLQRASLGLGFGLAALAALALSAWALVAIFTSDLGLFPRLLLGGGLASFVLLFLATLRARLRTRAYDPYTEIQR